MTISEINNHIADFNYKLTKQLELHQDARAIVAQVFNGGYPTPVIRYNIFYMRCSGDSNLEGEIDFRLPNSVQIMSENISKIFQFFSNSESKAK